MKPISRTVKKHSLFFNSVYNVNFGTSNTVAKIEGKVQKLGHFYRNAVVVLFTKNDCKSIAYRKPDVFGHYQFLGLNTTLQCFVVAFDLENQYNAVIQDNVVPK